ncbi:extensin-like domain-containing protein [Sinisalibacter aestuarii]|nr:extensin family protein [Sinisalibacter aestuarii]
MLGQAARAEAPDVSARPLARPDIEAAVLATVTSAALGTSAHAPQRSLRPLPRPRLAVVRAAPAQPALPGAAPVRATVQDPITALLQNIVGVPAPAAAAPSLTGASALAVARSLRPERRPGGFARLVAAITPPRATSRAGSVCGVPEIKGQALAPIPGRGACGVDQPVRVTSVSGIALAQQPTIDCTTAKALNTWVREGVIPAVGRKGGGVARINIIAHYSCRGRNNQPGARLSEHSFGHAVDIGGITLNDGTTLTVLDHWKSNTYGKIIKAMHKSACGPFGTVLGPNSDRYHQNHLHLDTARYRGGAYCR